MNLGIMGAGYVGLTTAICLASIGHKTIIYDISQEKTESLKNKNIPFHENGLDDLFENMINSKNLIISESINELVKLTDGCFVAVGTPTVKDAIDLSQVVDSTQSLAIEVKKENKTNYEFIVRSTVTPKSCEKIIQKIKNNMGTLEFGFSYVPEFLREGQAVNDFLNPDKIVIGSNNKKSFLFTNKIFEYFIGKTQFFQTNLQTAELIKYTNNSFFSMLISFANEISNISEKIENVDPVEVLKALVADRRITTTKNGEKILPELQSYLIPGCGFGGSCFPKDVKAILNYAQSLKTKTPLIESILEVNEERPNKIISLVEGILGTLNGKKISVLGLTFKPNTDDMRSSPSFDAIKLLNDKNATVFVYDPVISEINQEIRKKYDFTLVKSLEECLDESECAILLTSWKEFLSIDGELLKKHMKNPKIIDGRNFLSKEKFKEDMYYKIGFVKGKNSY